MSSGATPTDRPVRPPRNEPHRGCPAAFLALALLLSLPLPCLAHGFGQRYDLPLPLPFYLAAGGVTVIVSFLIMALLFRPTGKIGNYPRLNLLATVWGRALAHPVILGLIRTLSVVLFFLILAAGFIGSSDPFKNLAPTLVWVLWWVGLGFISGLAGDLWALINPWKILFSCLLHIVERIRGGRTLSPIFPYPAWLDTWPALLLLLGFIWMELVWPDSDSPWHLAQAVLTYSLITWLGMLLFGMHTWLRKGEVFSVLFGFLARLAPLEVRVKAPRVLQACTAGGCLDHQGASVNCYECFERARSSEREWNLRPYGAGLLDEPHHHPARLMFVLAMLASVTFDGLLATPLWVEGAEWILYSPGTRPFLLLFQPWFDELGTLITTFALVTFLLGFVLAYLLICLLIGLLVTQTARTLSSVVTTTRAIAYRFALPLLPIALAYHLAHYLSYLLVAGQYAIPLASDPFGFGWNLLGTQLYLVNIGIIDARTLWYFSVAVIVIGHILAIVYAHLIAIRWFRLPRLVWRSQLPMLVLMVAYTLSSLWILAQPIVEAP